MLKPNKTYVIEEDGSIHEMIFVGDSDWEEKSTTSIQEIRNNTLDEAINKFLEYGCVAVEWNKELSKEKLVDDVMRQAMGQVVYILEKLKS